MKILRAIRSIDPELGGPIEALIQGSKILENMGHVVEVVSIDSPQQCGISTFPLKIHAKGPGIGNYGYSRLFSDWLDKNVANYDCVIIEGLWQFPGYSVYKACVHHGTPYFIFVHGMLNPWSRSEYPLKHIKKSLYWLLAEYRVLKNANAVLFTNEQERNEARDIFWPNNYKELIVQIGTGKPPVDKTRYIKLFLDKFPEASNKRCLLFLSRLHPKKGCDLLIEAFARIKTKNDDLHLIMAGPDEIGWKKKLEKRAIELGIHESISWAGMLSGEMKWGAYYSADAFILPSHYENFGIVVVEAMACGLPVLISDKINIWRDIKCDNAGLIETDTIEGTEKLMKKFIDFSDEERHIIAENAIHSFQKRYEIEAAITSQLQAIRDNLDKNIS